MAEWLKAHDSKSCGQQCLGGSNPLASATNEKEGACSLFFIWKEALGIKFLSLPPITHQGVAQLVARAVRDCEVVSSNLITLTKTTFHVSVVRTSAKGLSAYGYKSHHPDQH